MPADSAAREPDIVAETRALLGAAAERGLTVRALGGLAVALRAGPDLPAALRREFEDVDLIVSRRERSALATMLEGRGYLPDRAFNAINGARRLIFEDWVHRRRVDVFVGSFEMCHPIPLDERLDVDAGTIPLAELLLTKLQIVELNDKDISDVVAILYDHDVADADAETVNAGRIARLCAADWGLWRTCTQNLERVAGALPRYSLPDGRGEAVAARVAALAERIEAESNSRRG
jgi:hypothetical protein